MEEPKGKVPGKASSPWKMYCSLYKGELGQGVLGLALGQPNSGPTTKELGKVVRGHQARPGGAHQARLIGEC